VVGTLVPVAEAELDVVEAVEEEPEDEVEVEVVRVVELEIGARVVVELAAVVMDVDWVEVDDVTVLALVAVEEAVEAVTEGVPVPR